MREAASFIAGQRDRSAQSLVAALVDIVGSYYSEWRGRRQLLALEELDDHLLLDIGLDRGDVRWALDQPLSAGIGSELRRRAHRRSRQNLL